MRQVRRVIASGLGTWLWIASVTIPVSAAVGDKAGWQFSSIGEPGAERQYLTFVGRNDGPRILSFACEADVDTFRFTAEDLSEFVGPIAKATMLLSGGPASFNIPGVVEPDPDTQVLGFVSEVPLSGGGDQRLAASLAPMLLDGKPIRITFGSKSRDLPPVTGLLAPGKRFMRACFGR